MSPDVAGANAHTKAELIDRLLRKLDEKGKFNGVVLVSEHSKVIYKKGFGYANYEEKKPNHVQSCFRLGSVTKQFTAMAIMILSDRGKLSYEDDIRKYLPTLPYEGVTIRHLLVHTSGLPDYMVLFDDEWDKEKLAYKEDILKLLAEHHPPVDFAPGEKYEYSNTGYSLLACIVERACGETFGEFMQKLKGVNEFELEIIDYTSDNEQKYQEPQFIPYFTMRDPTIIDAETDKC